MASNTKLAKEKTRKKREFYAKVQKAILDISTEKMMELGVKTDLKISYRSGNRYISFSQYGQKGRLYFKCLSFVMKNMRNRFLRYPRMRKSKRNLLSI